MVVSSSKIILVDGRCSISLRLLCKFQNDRFSGAANGRQNWNIMKHAHVIYYWKGNLPNVCNSTTLVNSLILFI